MKKTRLTVNKLKKNNRGVSLVELLVAVTIMAIIVAPFLHGFVTSARTNAKAKRVLEATTAGQNIMEEIKTSSLVPLLSGALNSSSEVVSDDEILNLTTTITKDLTANINGRDYMARVTVSPNPYSRTTPLFDGSSDTVSVDAVSHISDMNENNNAFFIMESTDDYKAAKHFNEADPASVIPHLHRDILFTIDTKNVSGVDQTVVNATVSYWRDTNPSDKYIPVDNKNVFITKNDGATTYLLENLFVLFTPLYNSPLKNSTYESITITNLLNMPINVILAKQDTTLVVPNANYGVSVYIKEGSRTDENERYTQVISNLVYADSSLNSEIQLTFQSGADAAVTQGTAKHYMDIIDGDLAAKGHELMLYDITIEVSRNGESLATLKGSKTE